MDMTTKVSTWLKGKALDARAHGEKESLWNVLYVEWEYTARKTRCGERFSLLSQSTSYDHSKTDNPLVVALDVLKVNVNYRLFDKSKTYRKTLKYARKLNRTLNTWKWQWIDSKANHWLHTDGKRMLHTCFGLFRTVNVYQSDLCYGGPEEGGWWYDHLSLVKSVKCWYWNAEGYRMHLESVYGGVINDQEGRPYTSVLNGKEVRVYIEDWKGESETRSRPYYS